MNFDWRSKASQRKYPLSWKKKIINRTSPMIRPFRLWLGRLALVEPVTYLELAARFVNSNKIDGDYCEFGVFTGRQFYKAYHFITAAEQTNINKRSTRFFAFDSFEGLPKAKGVDNFYPSFTEGGFAVSTDEFLENLRKNKVDLSRVKPIKGWFSDVLNDNLAAELNLTSVSIALIDCDLYESTVPVLEFLSKYLVDGAVIIFDDWHLFRANPCLGNQRAFREWSSRHPELTFSRFTYMPDSFQAAFIVNRNIDELALSH